MIPRLFIIEGPDNCGKSTLAQAIANRFNAVYWRLTSGQGLCEHAAMRLYQSNALDNAEVNIKAGRSVVLDRHWPSDQVYGTVLRGKPSIDGELLAAVELQCRSMNVVYINCWRDNATLEHAKQKDPDHPYEDEVYTKVVDGYQELFDELGKKAMVVPYYLDSFIKQENLLPAFLEGLSKL
jgi:thymidylate kinase